MGQICKISDNLPYILRDAFKESSSEGQPVAEDLINQLMGELNKIIDQALLGYIDPLIQEIFASCKNNLEVSFSALNAFPFPSPSSFQKRHCAAELH